MLDLNKIYCMDCMEGMKQLDNNCIDTVITDCPYGLSFMGKKWDYDIPSIEIWQECLRVLKPGGTALIFAGSRTQHHMAVNVEDAGFILKDCIIWLYGSGFPKATDISKQLDKKAGAERKVVGEGYGKSYVTQNKINKEQEFRPNDYYKDKQGNFDITAPSTPEAKLWNGWKSHSLKPAYEPILVAMKPNDGTYVNNALKWGVSGLNINGGRILTDPNVDDMLRKVNRKKRETETWEKGSGFKNETNRLTGVRPEGRYPSNIILDEESAKMLNEQSGISKSSRGKGSASMKTAPNDIYGKFKEGYKSANLGGLGDVGGASRFFYCAKTSKTERNIGVDCAIEKTIGHNRFDKCANCGGYILQNPNRKSACHCKSPKREDNKVVGNFHPTVKPLKLMEYLCILTKTPTGGIVLDPFIGSGTTALACKLTGRQFIGFENNADYHKIAQARLSTDIKKYKVHIDKKLIKDDELEDEPPEKDYSTQLDDWI